MFFCTAAFTQIFRQKTREIVHATWWCLLLKLWMITCNPCSRHDTKQKRKWASVLQEIYDSNMKINSFLTAIYAFMQNSDGRLDITNGLHSLVFNIIGLDCISCILILFTTNSNGGIWIMHSLFFIKHLLDTKTLQIIILKFFFTLWYMSCSTCDQIEKFDLLGVMRSWCQHTYHTKAWYDFCEA